MIVYMTKHKSGKSLSLDEMMESEDGDIFEVADSRGEFEQSVLSEMQIAAFAERSMSRERPGNIEATHGRLYGTGDF